MCQKLDDEGGGGASVRAWASIWMNTVLIICCIRWGKYDVVERGSDVCVDITISTGMRGTMHYQEQHEKMMCACIRKCLAGTSSQQTQNSNSNVSIWWRFILRVNNNWNHHQPSKRTLIPKNLSKLWNLPCISMANSKVRTDLVLVKMSPRLIIGADRLMLARCRAFIMTANDPLQMTILSDQFRGSTLNEC